MPLYARFCEPVLIFNDHLEFFVLLFSHQKGVQMKRIYVIIFYPFLMIGQQESSRFRKPLVKAMEEFTTIDIQASDDEYRNVLVQLVRNGTPLANGIRRQIYQFGESARLRLQREAGLSESDMKEIHMWVGRLHRGTSENEVRNDASGVLSDELNGYIQELFKSKQCRGVLRICHQSDSPSLIGLEDNVEISMKKHIPRIESGTYSEHVLTINDQFKDLDLTKQRALIHFFVAKMAVKHRLFSAVISKIIEKKRSSIGLKALLQSPAADDYREYVMMQAFAHCVLDDSQLAQPLSDIFDLYGSQHEFCTKHARSRNWLQRIHRFMRIDATTQR